jgi:hypothetical protein
MPPVGRSIPITIGVDSARYSGGLSMPDRRNRGTGGISFFQIQRLTPSAAAPPSYHQCGLPNFVETVKILQTVVEPKPY